MSYQFDSRFIPSFPALPVAIQSIDSGVKSVVMNAYVDTGADSTLVPLSLINSIGADMYYVARLRSHWGEHREVSLYLVDMEVAGEVFPGVEIVADELNTEMLLGRNILNRLLLLLDGPGNQTDVLTRRPERF